MANRSYSEQLSLFGPDNEGETPQSDLAVAASAKAPDAVIDSLTPPSVGPRGLGARAVIGWQRETALLPPVSLPEPPESLQDRIERLEREAARREQRGRSLDAAYDRIHARNTRRRDIE